MLSFSVYLEMKQKRPFKKMWHFLYGMTPKTLPGSTFDPSVDWDKIVILSFKQAYRLVKILGGKLNLAMYYESCCIFMKKVYSFFLVISSFAFYYCWSKKLLKLLYFSFHLFPLYLIINLQFFLCLSRRTIICILLLFPSYIEQKYKIWLETIKQQSCCCFRSDQSRSLYFAF